MLTEVLVALTIAAIGLSALFKYVDVGSSTALQAADDRTVTLIAQSRLAQLGHIQPLTDGVEEGELPNGYHWRVSSIPLNSGKAPPQPLAGHLVTIDISWLRDGRLHTRRFSTLKIGLSS